MTVQIVASRSLGDQTVQTKAEELSKNVVNQVLQDEQTLNLAISFLDKVSKDPGNNWVWF